MKARARRPLAIRVSYFNEEGRAEERELFDFESRVFCHEFDHILGVPFIHWKVSEGEIELCSDEPYDNLAVTIEYYKNRIKDSKNNSPEIFEQFDLGLINSDNDNFIDDQLEISFENLNKKKLSYEEVMLIDFEKGIRKDLKLKLKRLTELKNTIERESLH